MKYSAVPFLIFVWGLPDVAQAHSFSVPYVLPIPLWIYVYACMAMLVVSFAAVGYFLVTPGAVGVKAPVSAEVGAKKAFPGKIGQLTVAAVRGVAIVLLIVTIVAGFIGTKDPQLNISMTLFWVVFLLGFAYLVALIGDLFAIVNPWETMLDILEKCGINFSKTRVGYPEWLGYFPALGGYVGLVWIELFTDPRPSVLSVALLSYVGIVLIGSWLFGRTAWLRYGEFFGLFFRLLGSMAPVEYARAADQGGWRWRLRMPFSGIVDDHKEHLSLLPFVLFMLSSTSYDGLHDTEVWLNIYWKHLLQLIEPLWGVVNLKERATLIIKWHAVYQHGGLLLLLALYVGLYLFVVAVAKKMVGTKIRIGELALRFSYSLIPIAVVYNVTHYFTFLITQIRLLPWLIGDPFGFGWNPFHIDRIPQWAPLNMALIWHTQVALILIGHLVSVCVAHLIALRVFPSQRQAVLTQYPMLVLMMVYTSAGLWILSLHLTQQMADAGGG